MLKVLVAYGLWCSGVKVHVSVWGARTRHSSPPWALSTRLPGDNRLCPERIVTPGSKYLNSTELLVHLLNNISRFRTTDVCVNKVPADQGDDALEVLASDFFLSLLQEALVDAALRESAALRGTQLPR